MLRLLFVWLALLPVLLVSQPAFPLFSDGQRVVFLGNSITHGGLYHPYVHLYYLTRFPDRRVEMFNAGVAGHQAFHGIDRLETDVLVHEPDVVVVMFGMNDAGVGVNPEGMEAEKQAKLDERIATYRQNMDSLSALIQAAGVELVYLAPSIYDDAVENETPVRYGGNAAIARCREIIYELASQYEAPVVDFYTAMLAVNRIYQAADPAFTVVGRDRVHPGEAGHLLMAHTFLKAQGAPAVVAEMALSAAGEVLATNNCTISQVKLLPDGLAFVAKAGALPFPVMDNEACHWLPIARDLNRERLQVTGLPPGQYQLQIDQVRVGEFSAGALARGIDLGLIAATPQYQQALRLRALAMQRQQLLASRVRSLWFIEYGLLAGLSPEASQVEIEATFAAELAKIEDKPYYGYVRQQAENYRLYKPLQAETLAEVDRLTEAMHLLKQPLSQRYRLTRID